jgi:NEDD8-activating enzyme E1 regulatory subunit
LFSITDAGMSQPATEEPPRELTPPIIQPPSAKERKYDRQLRLWAASGQRALEESHVLLIVGEEGEGSQSSAAGAETIKNLVLPGIGGFTVADAATVTEADLGVNFFLDPSSVGKSRASEATKFLQELNPDVEGHSITESVSTWLPQEDSLKPYSLIILCGSVSEQTLSHICSHASEHLIPVLHVRCIGFYSAFAIQLPPEFPIVDTHPDPDTILDIRLLAPWPELSAEVDALGDLSEMSDHDHGHIPYILILLQTLKVWRATHDNANPSTFKDKTAFRDLVRSAARTNNPEGGEENFDEACAAVLKAIAPPSIGSGCKAMFEHPSCANITTESANFWIIANAIKQFYDSHSVLPLPGSVPDMKATSEGYIRLQNIYKSKARKDVAEVTASIRELEKSLSRQTAIEQSEIEAFCKNASHVRVLTNPNRQPLPSLSILQKDPKILYSLQKAFENDWENLFAIYVALETSSLPVPEGADTPSPPNPFSYINDNVSDEEKIEVLESCMAEVTRAKGGEVHNISSVTGGMVAQEVIKLLTRQYVPVDNVGVFDGVKGRVGVFKVGG